MGAQREIFVFFFKASKSVSTPNGIRQYNSLNSLYNIAINLPWQNVLFVMRSSKNNDFVLTKKTQPRLMFLVEARAII